MVVFLKALGLTVGLVVSYLLYLRPLAEVLRGIYNVLKRRLELRESKVQEREQRAAAQASTQCMWWTVGIASVILLCILFKYSPRA